MGYRGVIFNKSAQLISVLSGALGLLLVGCAAPAARQGPLHIGTTWPAMDDEMDWGQEEAPAESSPTPPEGKEAATEPNDSPTVRPCVGAKPWHIDLGMRGSYTKLGSTKQRLDRRLQLPMRLDVFHVFDEPYTPIDRRTDLGLTTFYAGLGRQESEYWVWTVYAGGGWGQDLNHQRFLNSTLEVDFHYAYYYTGVMAEFYPWKVPDPSASMTWGERLRSSRPFLLGGFEAGYVSAEGEGDYKLGGVTMYHDEQKIRDWLASVIIGAGWSFPITDRLSLNLMGDYSFHFYRPEEYNGWNWVTALRYTF